MSDCLFDYVEQRGDRHLWICPQCGRKHLSKYDDARLIRRNCTTRGDRGLGDTIARLLTWLGFKGWKGCKCRSRQEWLNRLMPYRRT